jgi:glycosyltransferase involved in cell wall biosynthesis
MSLKVLHIVGFAEDQGGVLSVIRNLQGANIGRDWSHAVWVQDCYEEVRTPHLDYRYSKFARDGNISPSLLLNMGPALLSLRNLIEREKFDIVHSHSRGTLPLAVLITKLLRRPVIFTNHNYASRKGLYRWASKQKRMHTVVLTPNMGRYYGINLGSPMTQIIPAFCADRFFDEPLVKRRACFSPTSKLRLLGVGLVTEWKGWHTVCEAINLLEPSERECVEFTHWGDVRDPEYGQRVEEYVRQNRLEEHVHFMGPTDNISAALNDADWLMHPAIMDPFPVSVIEALAIGLPALVSNSGGPVDMVKPGETGAIFEPGDAADLADKIRTIIRGDLIAVSPSEIRESVRDISASRVAARYYDLYMKVLGRTPVNG